MTGRSKALTAVFAVLMIVVTVLFSGCSGGPSNLSRLDNGGIKITEGDSVWIWQRSGNTEQLTLNDMLIAVVQGSHVQFTLTGGQKLDVTLDNGMPSTVKMSWRTNIGQDEYAQMDKALSVRDLALQEAGGASAGSLGWVILMLIVIIAGVLLFLYAGRLVNSWKLGGIFSSHDTAKSLLIFKAIGVLLVAIGVIILLVVIF